MIASWNQACFQGGYVDVGVSLPGSTTVSGTFSCLFLPALCATLTYSHLRYLSVQVYGLLVRFPRLHLLQTTNEIHRCFFPSSFATTTILAWMMSNLGRAGYGGSLDGSWPYVRRTSFSLEGSGEALTSLPSPSPSQIHLPPLFTPRHQSEQVYDNCDVSVLQFP